MIKRKIFVAQKELVVLFGIPASVPKGIKVAAAITMLRTLKVISVEELSPVEETKEKAMAIEVEAEMAEGIVDIIGPEAIHLEMVADAVVAKAEVEGITDAAAETAVVVALATLQEAAEAVQVVEVAEAAAEALA